MKVEQIKLGWVRVCGDVDCKKDATTRVKIKSASGFNDGVGFFCAIHAKTKKRKGQDR